MPVNLGRGLAIISEDLNMTNFFARRGAAYVNEMNRSLGALLGISTGILSDRQLADAEIRFLNDWLHANSAIAT